jgi:hypothetical protein
MKIRFSIVSPSILQQVRAEVDVLQHAVNVADMDGVDAATARLLSLTVDCHSVDLSEEDWRAFLEGIRSKHPAFQSSYLFPGEMGASIFPAIAAGDHVLELPHDGSAGEEEESDV